MPNTKSNTCINCESTLIWDSALHVSICKNEKCDLKKLESSGKAKRIPNQKIKPYFISAGKAPSEESDRAHHKSYHSNKVGKSDVYKFFKTVGTGIEFVLGIGLIIFGVIVLLGFLALCSSGGGDDYYDPRSDYFRTG